jgi:hypothetical protein
MYFSKSEDFDRNMSYSRLAWTGRGNTAAGSSPSKPNLALSSVPAVNNANPQPATTFRKSHSLVEQRMSQSLEAAHHVPNVRSCSHCFAAENTGSCCSNQLLD